jgi:POT family proton-dependent oligopeptide transporter
MKPMIAFWVLAVSTLLERWAWSGYRASLVLDLVDLGWGDDAKAYSNYGTAALVYFFPLLVAPVLTSLSREKSAIRFGLLVSGIAYLILGITRDAGFMVAGFLALAFGRSLVLNILPSFIATINSAYGNRNDLDTWMTRLYMFSNAGSFLGPVVAGVIYYWRGDYRLAYLVSASASVISLALVHLFCAHWRAPLVEVKSVSVNATPTRGSYAVVTLLTVTAFSVIFWSGFEMRSGPLNEFAKTSVDRWVAGIDIPAAGFQAANPLFVVALAGLFDYLWRTLDSRRRAHPISPLSKQASGLLFLSVGFWTLYFVQPAVDAVDAPKVSWHVLVLVYLFHTIGELLMEPIGQSLVLRLAPRHWQTFFLSVWNASTGLASVLAAIYAQTWKDPSPAMWFGLGLLTLLAAVLLFVVSQFLTGKCQELLFERRPGGTETQGIAKELHDVTYPHPYGDGGAHQPAHCPGAGEKARE